MYIWMQLICIYTQRFKVIKYKMITSYWMMYLYNCTFKRKVTCLWLIVTTLCVCTPLKHKKYKVYSAYIYLYLCFLSCLRVEQISSSIVSVLCSQPLRRKGNGFPLAVHWKRTLKLFRYLKMYLYLNFVLQCDFHFNTELLLTFHLLLHCRI